MAGALKHAAKSVSWAPGLKLCQVRLFLSEDTPALSGFATQDHLQAKTSRLFHIGGGENDESLPPGFETPYHMNIKQLKYETSQIKLTKWKCPAKFFLDAEWLVVSGDESKEVEAENKRQLGTLEAIYPRTSSIPPNPSVSPEVERSSYDDSHTPLVPIIAIEEEEMDPACEVSPVPEHSTPEQLLNSTCFIPSVSHGLLHPQGNAALSAPLNPPSAGLPSIPIIPGVEPDVAAAASAVFTAIMKSNDKGSLIDHELLIKILSDPKTVEKLILESGVQSQVPTSSLPSQLPALSVPVTPTVSLQSHVPNSAPSAAPSHVPYNDPSFSSGQNSRIFSSQNMFPTQNPTNLPSLPLHHQSNSNNMPIRPPPPMDPNYINKSTAQGQGVEDLAHYKSLIHQHGGEYNLPESRDAYHSQYFNAGHRNSVDRGEFQQEALEQKRDTKINRRLPKSSNHCIYYHSAKGCKKGSNCSYVHDPSVPQRLGDMRNIKRVKLDSD